MARLIWCQDKNRQQLAKQSCSWGHDLELKVHKGQWSCNVAGSSGQARNDHEAAEKLKFVIYQRPKAFQNGTADAGNKNGAPKTVEERIEEYNKARARIFSGSISADTDAATALGTLSTGRDEPVNVEPSADEIKVNTLNNRSRVAVFKDTEKDRSDPDYDRNYKRLAYPLVNSCSH